NVVVAIWSAVLVPGPMLLISQAVPVAALASVLPISTATLTSVYLAIEDHDSAVVTMPSIFCADGPPITDRMVFAPATSGQITDVIAMSGKSFMSNSSPLFVSIVGSETSINT